MMAVIALINSSFLVSAHEEHNENEEESWAPYASCPYCRIGYAVLYCDDNPIYDGDATHKYDINKTCTKEYFKATYIGYKCKDCGRISSLIDGGYAVHDCFIIHLDCGRPNEILCRRGNL